VLEPEGGAFDSPCPFFAFSFASTPGVLINDINPLGVLFCSQARGISGGEKKRLSLACELIGSPSLIFADEPTSGLDAFQAELLLKSLKSLAEAGHTVIFSIHQPRSSIYSMIDDVILLSEGEIAYSGAADQLVPYFAQLGHSMPKVDHGLDGWAFCLATHTLLDYCHSTELQSC
jgi:ABC-type uncharacterized transport system ATPase subunit